MRAARQNVPKITAMNNNKNTTCYCTFELNNYLHVHVLPPPSPLSLLLTGIGILVSSFPMQFFIIVQRLILALGRGDMVFLRYSSVGLTSS